jgi:hypothetical protein
MQIILSRSALHFPRTCRSLVPRSDLKVDPLPIGFLMRARRLVGVLEHIRPDISDDGA